MWKYTDRALTQILSWKDGAKNYEHSYEGNLSKDRMKMKYIRAGKNRRHAPYKEDII